MITRRQWMGTACGATAVGFSLKAAAPVPRNAAEVTIEMVSGERLLLSSFKGKVVALEFLLTTCSHCQHSAGILQQMYQEFGAQGFQPVGTAINPRAHTLVPAFVGRLGLKYPVGVTPQAVAYEFLGASLVEPLMMPQLVFIDRKGIVRAQYGGGDDFFKSEEVNMRRQIETLLKGKSGGKSGSAKKSPK